MTRRTIGLLGMDALLGPAAHGMADHSSPDWRARRGADTQRAVYARAQLQIKRGGRTTSSMSCDTNVSKLLLRWGSDTYIWCLLPQLLWCMPLHVMFPLPTTSLHLVRPELCCMCWLRTICTAILAKYMYACAYPTWHRFLVLANKTKLIVAGACAHGSESGLICGCAHALLKMWVHVYFCAMQ